MPPPLHALAAAALALSCAAAPRQSLARDHPSRGPGGGAAAHGAGGARRRRSRPWRAHRAGARPGRRYRFRVSAQGFMPAEREGRVRGSRAPASASRSGRRASGRPAPRARRRRASPPRRRCSSAGGATRPPRRMPTGRARRRGRRAGSAARALGDAARALGGAAAGAPSTGTAPTCGRAGGARFGRWRRGWRRCAATSRPRPGYTHAEEDAMRHEEHRRGARGHSRRGRDRLRLARRGGGHERRIPRGGGGRRGTRSSSIAW